MPKDRPEDIVAQNREVWAHQQAMLVSALMGHAPSPPGFDEARVKATARSLMRKRLRSVIRVWPKLAESMGTQFESSFAAYAQDTPLPAQGSALADGRAFLRWMEQTAPLPEPLRLLTFWVDLRYTSTTQGDLRLRRGPYMKVARMQSRWIIAFRMPWQREWVIEIPWRWER